MFVTVVDTVQSTIELSLPYPPSGNHSVRHAAGGRHYLAASARAYRGAVLVAVAGRGLGSFARRGALQGPLALSWLLLPPDARARDSDNVMKAVRDALTKAGVWVDDSNRVIRREVIEWSDPVPGGRVELTIEVLG